MSSLLLKCEFAPIISLHFCARCAKWLCIRRLIIYVEYVYNVQVTVATACECSLSNISLTLLYLSIYLHTYMCLCFLTVNMATPKLWNPTWVSHCSITIVYIRVAIMSSLCMYIM